VRVYYADNEYKRITVTSNAKTRDVLKICMKELKDKLENPKYKYYSLYSIIKLGENREKKLLDRKDLPYQIYSEISKQGGSVVFTIELKSN